LIETWLQADTADLFQLDGYEHNYIHRAAGRKGGGVSIYTREDILFNKCEPLCEVMPGYEQLVGKISIKNSITFKLIAIYRIPNKPITEFNTHIKENLFTKFSKREKVIIMGDLNINLINTKKLKPQENEFLNIMKEHGFKMQIKNEATRFPSGTLLDNCFVNFNKGSVSQVINYPISDHCPILYSFDANVPKQFTTIKFRDFSVQKTDGFMTVKDALFNSYYIASNNASQEIDNFVNFLWSITNQHFPFKEKNISTKKLTMPWVTQDVWSLVNKKHKLFICLKKKQISYDYFNAYSQLLKLFFDKLKNNYFINKFSNNKNNSKKTWNTINDLLGRNKKEKINMLEVNDDEIFDKKEIVKCFNEYFSSIAQETQEKLDAPALNYDNLIPFNESSMFIFPTSHIEISNIIKKLENKSNNEDLPIVLFKMINENISPILSKLINMCFEQGLYPDILKIGRVIPVHKSGDKKCMNNYRPISTLSLINKIFERVLSDRIISFFEKHKLLCDNQFSYRKLKDTQRATLLLINEILPLLGTDEMALCVFIDFSKAFDTVDHAKLLAKLERYGVRGTANNLIKSYLLNRKQYVQNAGVKSETLPVNVDVPQGSVIGPLLYIIYANDLHYLTKQLISIMYADDTTIIVKNKCINNLISDSNRHMKSILDWCNFNKLSLNSKKTKVIIFNKKQNTGNIPKIKIGNNEIEVVSQFKYLGYNIDTKFNHSSHLKYLVGKLSSLKYITYKIKQHMTERAALNFYFGMVQSKLQYGILLYAGASQVNKYYKKLKALQNRIVFNLFSLPNDNYRNIKKIYKRVKILPIEELYKVNVSSTFYDVINNNYLPKLYEIVVNSIRDHRYLTRNRNHYKLPFPKTIGVKLNFVYNALQIWNSLDQNIKNLPSSKRVKKQVTKEILRSF
jgi:hypothetical protein